MQEVQGLQPRPVARVYYSLGYDAFYRGRGPIPMSAVRASQVMVVSPTYSLTLGIRSIQALKRSNLVGERWNSSTRLPLIFFALLSYPHARSRLDGPLLGCAAFPGTFVSVHYAHNKVAPDDIVAPEPDE